MSALSPRRRYRRTATYTGVPTWCAIACTIYPDRVSGFVSAPETLEAGRDGAMAAAS